MTTKIQTFGGNLGIGTNDPGSHRLNVYGSLKTSSLMVNGVEHAQVPIGMLGLWFGENGTQPTGWELCDGQTHARSDGGGDITTPDLRSRFIRGATGDAPSTVAMGTTGGANNVTLSVANLAPHSHGVTVSTANANHNHSMDQSNMNHSHTVSDGGVQHNHGDTTATNNKHAHNTEPAGTQHVHSLVAVNAPHLHPTSTNNQPHRHTVGINPIQLHVRSGPAPIAITRTLPAVTSQTGQFVKTHSHTSANNNAPHAHQLYSGGQAPHQHNTGVDNMSHTHSLENVQMRHLVQHNTGADNAPHSHEIDVSNAPHSHTGSSSNTGSGQSFSVLNTYYTIAYIMKT